MTTYRLTDVEKSLASKKISYWLELESDQNSVHDLRKFIEEYFPGCESLYISLQINDIVEHAELDDEKIPRFVIDIIDIELFEGKSGKKIREMLLLKLFKKDYWLLRKFDRKTDAKDWDVETARTLLNQLISKNWIPGGGWARQFVSIFEFPMKFSGIASPQKLEKMESVEKRMHLEPLENFQANIKSQVLKILDKKDPFENRCMLRLPTGAGKTRTAAEGIMDFWKNRPSHVSWIVWIAHTEELCEQALQCFKQIWEEFGEEGTILNIYRVWGSRSLPDPNDEGIIIAGIDQLYSLIPKNDDDQKEDEIQRIRENVGLVVIDEAHHSVAPIYSTVLNSFGLTRYPDDTKQIPFIGLTATPFRSSDKETDLLQKKFANNLLWPNPNFQPSDSFSDQWRDWNFVIDKLTQDKVLSKPNFHYLETDSVFELDNEETRFLYEKNLLPQKLLDRVGRDTIRNLEVFKSLKEWADKGKTILFFGATLNQAVMMSKFLNDNNVQSAVITGKTKYGTRQSYIRMFKENRIQVLCNYQVLTTGFDAPKIDTIIIARPTGSRSLYEQMIGRGLRGSKFGGTDECDIVTVIDNILNHEKRRIKLGYEQYAETTETVEGVEIKKIRNIAGKYPSDESSNFAEPTVPKPEDVFTEDMLYDLFRVQRSGGIRFTKNHNTVLLIDSDSGNYHDRVDEKSGNIIHTGTGEGDQGFDFGVGKFNARVRDSVNSTLLYFYKPERNRLVFKYPVKFDSFFYDTEKNVQGKERRVIKFRLKIILTQCPSCKKIASTEEEIEDLFGFRNSNEKTISQSWCRECRSF